jgi:F-type H+-transporting ATPase subunit delta
MKISKESRKLSRELFRASFTDGGLDPMKVRRLVESIVEKKPRRFVEVLKNYQRLVRIEMHKHQALIESAIPLNSETTARVTQELKAKYGRDLTVDFRQNPDLIGGLRIKIGSDVWDGSIRNRLQRLEQELLKA